MSIFSLDLKTSKLFLRISLFSICALFSLAIIISIVYGDLSEPTGWAYVVVQGLALLITTVFELSIIILLIDAYHFLRQQDQMNVKNMSFLVFGNALAAYWFYYKRMRNEPS